MPLLLDRTIYSVMGLKLLQITGTFLTTIWTVPMARSAVSANLAFQATFARPTGCSQAPVYARSTRLV